MGKSGKKVKSERINAIRKQYDAFLEEDKKRRDRNEYILDRLDKMRSCTAMVPVRHTQTINAFVELNDSNNENANRYIGRTGPNEKQRITFNQVYSSSILTTLNEETLVKELSKKYILIPKHQGPSGYEFKLHANSAVEDCNDWRSKYSILEELKKSEKEDEDGSKSVPTNNPYLSNNKNKDFGKKIVNEVTNINDAQNDQLIIKADTSNFQELPNLPQPILDDEAEITSQNIDIKNNLSNMTKLSNKIAVLEKNVDLVENPKYNNNNTEKDESTFILSEKEILQAKHEIEAKPDIEGIDNKLFLNTNFEWQEQTINDKPGETNESNNEKMQNNINPNDVTNEGDCSTVSEIAFEGPNYDPNFENTTVEVPELMNGRNNLPVTSTSDEVQELAKEEVYAESNVDIDSQEVNPETTENISPPVNLDQRYEQHQTNSQQEYEASVDEPQIQNFGAEQNNMYYSEQAEDYTYDQTGTGDNANTESYEHDQNYAYYDEAAQNEVYSNNINEQEESKELYDPNYQEDPQIDNVQQYENENNREYENQQNYDQVFYQDPNYNAVEEMQQQLDVEQGYEEPFKAVEGDLDDVTSKEATLENLSRENEMKVT